MRKEGWIAGGGLNGGKKESSRYATFIKHRALYAYICRTASLTLCRIRFTPKNTRNRRNNKTMISLELQCHPLT